MGRGAQVRGLLLPVRPITRDRRLDFAQREDLGAASRDVPDHLVGLPNGGRSH